MIVRWILAWILSALAFSGCQTPKLFKSVSSTAPTDGRRKGSEELRAELEMTFETVKAIDREQHLPREVIALLFYEMEREPDEAVRYFHSMEDYPILAWMHLTGRGVAASKSKAEHYLGMAAERFHWESADFENFRKAVRSGARDFPLEALYVDRDRTTFDVNSRSRLRLEIARVRNTMVRRRWAQNHSPTVCQTLSKLVADFEGYVEVDGKRIYTEVSGTARCSLSLSAEFESHEQFHALFMKVVSNKGLKKPSQAQIAQEALALQGDLNKKREVYDSELFKQMTEHRFGKGAALSELEEGERLREIYWQSFDAFADALRVEEPSRPDLRQAVRYELSKQRRSELVDSLDRLFRVPTRR